MVLHRLVDVKVGTRRCVKAGEQLVHHHEQLHVRRFFCEQLFGPFLIGLSLSHARLGVDAFQKFSVGVVNELLVCLGIGAGFLLRDILCLRVVRSHYRALSPERSLLEKREILACFEDAGCNQDGIAALIR